MPLYDFKCKDCGAEVEVYLHKPISDGDIGRCDCGGLMQRLFQLKFNVNLHGAGKSAEALVGRVRRSDMDPGPMMTALHETLGKVP